MQPTLIKSWDGGSGGGVDREGWGGDGGGGGRDGGGKNGP